MTFSISDEDLKKAVEGKKVLITGAGGSIGSELCRLIVKGNPKALILLSHSEHSLFAIEQELRPVCDIPLYRVLGDIRSLSRIKEICQEFVPHIIFHTAAIKHVPLAEDHITETVLTNIIGTANVIGGASSCGARVVFISTDKAVNPTSIMGATKRAAELFCALPWRIDVKIVRFGNVIGSSGSVVPIFQRCIEEDRPLLVTHEDVDRYFMEIPEAAALVIQTLNLKGSLFVLDMGEPVRIYDLAQQMIDEAGKGLPIEITGLRPGEKIHEELFYPEELDPAVNEGSVFIGKPMRPDNVMFLEWVHAIGNAANSGNVGLTLQFLRKLVPNYETRH